MSQLQQVKLSTPLFDEVVPSTKKKVKIKPFRVADEKVLLVAAESKDTKQMISALRQVVGNCVDGVDVEELASFDLEYLFMKLRAVSVGESTDVSIKCKSCETANKVNVDLSTISVVNDPTHNREVKISDDLMFIMKYPDITDINVSGSLDSMLDVIVESVSTVIFGEEAIEITDAEKEDLKNIVNDMTTSQFSAVRDFFETMPKLKKEIEFDCKECMHLNKLTLEGMADFF